MKSGNRKLALDHSFEYKFYNKWISRYRSPKFNLSNLRQESTMSHPITIQNIFILLSVKPISQGLMHWYDLKIQASLFPSSIPSINNRRFTSTCVTIINGYGRGRGSRFKSGLKKWRVDIPLVSGIQILSTFSISDSVSVNRSWKLILQLEGACQRLSLQTNLHCWTTSLNFPSIFLPTRTCKH